MQMRWDADIVAAGIVRTEGQLELLARRVWSAGEKQLRGVGAGKPLLTRYAASTHRTHRTHTHNYTHIQAHADTHTHANTRPRWVR